jgi:hypothetical protein
VQAANMVLSRWVGVLAVCFAAAAVDDSVGAPPVRAARICRPAPPVVNSSLPRCLVIGDSVRELN